MNLTPVQFGQVAKRGVYVYCYLDETFSPYYVGVGTRADRACGRHACVVPPHDRIVVLRSGLTKQQAIDWEEFYIARYGRKRDGGILLNKAKRGASKGCNYERSAEYRAKMSKASQGRRLSEKAKAKISQARKGVNNNSPDRTFEELKGPKSAQHKQSISAAHFARNAASKGLTVAQYASASPSARKHFNRWMKAVPGRTVQDWIETYCAAA